MTEAKRRARRICALPLVAVLAGCAASLEDATPQPTGLGCIDDSKRCIDERQASLKQMIADPQRRWVREPASAQAYASGVRMFAYKAKKRELTCDELAHGAREAAAAPQTLKAPGAGIPSGQISRAEMLSAEVHRELNAEMGKRCKGGAGAPVKRG